MQSLTATPRINRIGLMFHGSNREGSWHGASEVIDSSYSEHSIKIIINPVSMCVGLQLQWIAKERKR
ncbi:MAG: hypothetical protein KGH64_02015 [Candidatus Micrarchaeota archaeon]|nr:hypothetical protein [Candidatus Micrarchaeota archaeon]MDE1834092.1 hypothetical protein [Candidatus Micrarchaeota archaeon]MDE1859732.1 hypothetical protein [Candidatus Micrarchaeota archaeon]